MNHKRSHVRKIIGFLILGIVIVAAAFYAFNSYIYAEKQGENTYEQYRGTLAGEYLCLPHKHATAPETDECAPVLLTDVGEYYAIDFNAMSQAHRPLSVGDRISARGLITPIERLSTDHWQQYPIEAIFSVTDSLQILE